jgi:hypothetical protein
MSEIENDILDLTTEEEETEEEIPEPEIKEIKGINLNDDFSIIDIIRKANKGEYVKANGSVDTVGFIRDCLRVYVDIPARQISMIKSFSARINCFELIYKSPGDMRQILGSIVLKGRGMKKITGYDVITDKFKTLFSYHDTTFFNATPRKLFSIFPCWKWQPSKTLNISKIESNIKTYSGSHKLY